MNSRRSTVDAVRNDILDAIAEVRTVARSEHDEQRSSTADWVDEQFIDMPDAHALRAAAANALTPDDGMGVFRRRWNGCIGSRGRQIGRRPAHARILGI